jgi:hypothetical protein
MFSSSSISDFAEQERSSEKDKVRSTNRKMERKRGEYRVLAHLGNKARFGSLFITFQSSNTI